jgi:hypothetical protein
MVQVTGEASQTERQIANVLDTERSRERVNFCALLLWRNEDFGLQVNQSDGCKN